MIIIPGSKSTINDFLYIRKSGLVEEIKKQYGKGTMVLGICGGYQMLGKKITDKFRSESDKESIEGVGLLDISTEFLQDKNTNQVDFEINAGALNCNHDFKEAYKKIVSSSAEAVRMKGYEIHMGISKKNHRKEDKLISLFKIKSRGGAATEIDDGFIAFGSRTGSVVLGTYIHGILDNFIFRKIILELLRKKNNIKASNIGSDSVSYKNFKEEQYDKLADIFRKNMDMKLFYKILKHGV
jgi:adenosylcobyric acid synthase